MNLLHLSNNLHFLKNSGITFSLPNYSQYRVEEDKISIKDLTVEQISWSNIENVPHLKFICIFSLLDYYIDTIEPQLEGKRYANKYIFLSSYIKSDIYKIIAETYRISFFFRNRITHQPNNFIVTSSEIRAFKNEKQIILSSEGLEALIGLINLFISNEFNGLYKKGLIFDMHQKMQNGVIEINDDYGALISINYPIKLNANRHILVNPNFTCNKSKIIFHNIIDRTDYKSTDIPIIKDNKKYLIPLESLDNKNSLLLSDLHLWEYLPNHAFLNDFFNQ